MAKATVKQAAQQKAPQQTASQTPQEIIDGSGNNFHCKVASYFRQKGWTTRISPYYVDAATDKAREIDLIVEEAHGPFIRDDGKLRSIRVRLYVECKYINQLNVFWFDAMDIARAEDWIVANTPFKSRRTHSTLIDKHHYLNAGGEVAKLFASESKKTEDNEPIFKALNQCLSGFIYHRNTFATQPLIPRQQPEEEVFSLQYPVIVCSDFAGFWRISVEVADPPSAIQGNFLMEVDYAYPQVGQQRGYFLIDVISFDRLDGFLQALNREVDAAKLRLGD